MLSYNKINGQTFNLLGIRPIFQFLSKDADGDQTNGNINVSDNYADVGTGVDPLGLTKFYIKAPEKHFIVLNRMIVSVRDSGSFDSGSYGNGITLANGINMYAESDPVGEIVFTGVPIKTNPDWGIYCFDTDVSSYGQGDEQLLARWTFAKMGRPVILDGDVNEKVGLIFNDDLSGLVSHYFQVQGLLVPKDS